MRNALLAILRWSAPAERSGDGAFRDTYPAPRESGVALRLPPHSKGARALRARRGTVLILVLWISFSLVALALYFGDAMRVEYRAAENASGNLQAAQAADGARRYVESVLQSDATDGQTPSTEDYAAEKVEVGDTYFWIVGRANDSSRFSQTPTYGLVGEAGKLNVNATTTTLEMLAALPGMTADLAAAIVDWRDADTDPLPGGAESGDYLLRDPAYMCKDAPFETPEELRLVMGVDRAVLYGEDTNRNGILDPNEDDGDASSPPDNADGKLDPGLLEYVTVFSREPGANGQGYAEGRVNVNVAPVEVLACIPGILQDHAAKLVSVRQGKTAEELANVEWIRATVGEDSFAEAKPFITTKSYQFSADVIAVGRDGRGLCRDLLVFDTTGDPPAVIYRRDLTSCGWPLGAQVRQALEANEETK